jgi:hypothetical protein
LNRDVASTCAEQTRNALRNLSSLHPEKLGDIGHVVWAHHRAHGRLGVALDELLCKCVASGEPARTAIRTRKKLIDGVDSGVFPNEKLAIGEGNQDTERQADTAKDESRVYDRYDTH